MMCKYNIEAGETFMQLRRIHILFPQGRNKALTFSYDDGRQEDRRLVSIFRKHGLKATFNLNSGEADTDERRIPMNEWKELYDGFELASHTVNHPPIDRCPLSLVAQEIMEDRKAIEAVTGYPVRGFAYPFGSFTPEIISLLPSLGIRYGRLTGDSDGFAIPEDFYKWKATCHHDHRLLENAEAFLSINNDFRLNLMYVWGHSYEFTNDDNWEVIERFAYLAGGRDDIWYAANIEIVDYMDAARRIIFSADLSLVSNPSAMDVWLSVDGMPVIVPGGKTIVI